MADDTTPESQDSAPSGDDGPGDGGVGDEGRDGAAAGPAEGRDLTDGSVIQSLFSMSWPMLVGMVSVMSMSLVDTYFVGQLGTLPLAAMSYSFPVIFFVGGITTGLSTAASSVISRTYGRGDREAARRQTTHALMLAASLVTTLLVAGFPNLRALFELLGAQGDVVPLILDYMTIWMFGMLFFIGPVVGTASLRARGDARTPMYLMIGGSLVNAVLDPTLIFGLGPIPKLGIEGAALSTAIARGLMTVVVIVILWRRGQMRPLAPGVFEDIGKSWRSLLGIGAPAAATNVMVPVTTAILTRLVSDYGDPAVAAYGAGTRIESMAILVFFALSAGLSPLVGQNWGAGLRGRVMRAVKISALFSLGWGVVTWGSFALLSGPIADAFTEGSEAASQLERFLWIVPLGHGLQGVFYICNGALNAIDKPLVAAALSLLRTLVLTAPLAWVASYFFDLSGIFGSIAVANATVGLSAAAATYYLLRTSTMEEDGGDEAHEQPGEVAGE